MKIKNIHAYEILASGGYPTVEAVVELEDGTVATSSVPYGASAGSKEATVLEDKDASRYDGHGMLIAVANINDKISKLLVGLESENQRELDQLMIQMDGTHNKSNLGGNAILAVSIAIARATSQSKHMSLYAYLIEAYATGVIPSTLPQPMMVVIEGGKHADHSTDLQEFCLSATREGSVSENVRMLSEIYHKLRVVLKQQGLSTNVGNEGAFAPSGIRSNEAPFAYIMEAIKSAGYQPGTDLGISIDAAASEFYQLGSYQLKLEHKSLSSLELIEYYRPWLDKYPLVSIEDMHAEDDWDGWMAMNHLATEKGIPLIGDDLTVTNPAILQKAIELKAISGILIKLNQIGTVTETIDCCLLARKHGLMTVVSHRGGGETNDTTMVDLAVAVGSSFIKVGPTRGERVSKYNRLMAIERELHDNH